MKATDKLKQAIKELVIEQKTLKPQRKESFIGNRTANQVQATYRVWANSYQLRLMYAAYGLLRGKPYSVTENKYPEESHPLKQFDRQINKIINEYQTSDESEKVVCIDGQIA